MNGPNGRFTALRRTYIAELPERLGTLRHLVARLKAAKRPPSHLLQEIDTLLRKIGPAAEVFGFAALSQAVSVLGGHLAGLRESTAPVADAFWYETEHLLDELYTGASLPLPGSEAIPTASPAASEEHPLILLLMADAELEAQLRAILAAASYQLECFDDLSALQRIGDGQLQPAAVLIDKTLIQSVPNGKKAIAAMQSRCVACPPVIFLSDNDDMASRLAAYRGGASHCLRKQLVPERLPGLLGRLVRRPSEKPYRVMLVDDDPLYLLFATEILQRAGMEVSSTTQPMQVLDMLQAFPPDVLVLDVNMPEVSGPEVAAILREDEKWASLPILFLSSERNIAKQLLALGLGADDFITKPVEPAYLVALVSARARRSRAFHDLMGIFKRNFYEREREHFALNRHAIVSTTDAAGTILYANDKFCEVSGYNREELVGQNHRIVNSGLHDRQFFQGLWQTISQGKVWRGEVCNRSKSGGLYWVDSTIVPFMDENGVPYQYVSIRTDVTRLKILEQTASANAERLRRSQAFANIGTWDWNILTGMVYWSESVAPLFGHQAGELETTYENYLAALHPDDRNRLVQAVNACVEEGTEYNIEHRVIWPDGQIRWLQGKGDVVRAADGTPVQMLGVVIDIHERKMAELSLGLLEKRFRSLFEIAPVGVTRSTLDGHFLEVNEAMLQLTGHTEEEYHQLDFWQLTAEKYLKAEQGYMDKLLKLGRFGPFEKELLHKNGTRIPVLVNGVVVQDESGNAFIWTIVQNIAERKRHERTLSRERRRLMQAQELARLGNWETDLETGELYWSEIIYEIFGQNPDHFVPTLEGFYAMVHPDDLPRVHASEAVAFASGQYDVIHRIIRPDGKICFVHERGSGEFDANGKVIRMLGTVQDITSIKQAEQDLQIFRSIFDATDQGIVVTTPEGLVVYTNAAFERMVGSEQDELLGEEIAAFMPESVRTWSLQVILHAAKTGQPWSGLLPVQRKDGSEFVSKSNVAFVHNEHGELQYIFNVLSDYSDELERQFQLRRAREQAEQASQAKSEFLSSMSHELRTPMNAILGFAQILEYDASLDQDQRDSVQEILGAGRHLLELINDVLDLSKIESGQLNLSLGPVLLAEVAEECASLIEPIAGRHGLSFTMGDFAGLVVVADRLRLKQVLLNLLSNAVKYNTEGGSIRFEARREKDRVVISVADTGKGFDVAKLEELFQPFNRLGAESSGIEGTGIGLTITKRLVEMMGGQIEPESVLGRGSLFKVSLPMAEAVPAGEDERSQTGDMVLTPVDSARKSVLYIEDNPANLKLVSQLLARKANILLRTAFDPSLGIELARLHKPDLILLDINLPGMNGYQVLQIFRDDAALQQVPVVAVTANAMPSDIAHGKAAGFADYLVKPLNIERFYTVIEQFLFGGSEDVSAAENVSAK